MRNSGHPGSIEKFFNVLGVAINSFQTKHTLLMRENLACSKYRPPAFLS